MSEQVATKELNPFDADMRRLEQIQIEHLETRPLLEQDANVAFLLSFIDKLWNEYSRTMQRLDDLTTCRPGAAPDDKLRQCQTCDSDEHDGPCEQRP
jgi:hypothetical protein